VADEHKTLLIKDDLIFHEKTTNNSETRLQIHAHDEEVAIKIKDKSQPDKGIKLTWR
jgi:hypothetical protein